MQRTDFAEMSCPAARALACVGEWWSLLILRDAFQGLRRFDEFKESLGISTNILARRLAHLTREGILERRPYQRRPLRHEYLLTPRGRELFPLLLFLYRWGNKYRAGKGIAVELADRRSGAIIDPVAVDRRSGAAIAPEEVMLKLGPAASPAIIARARWMAGQAGTAGAGTRAATNMLQKNVPQQNLRQKDMQQKNKRTAETRAAKRSPTAHNGSNKSKRATS